MYLVRHAPTQANSGTQVIRGQMDVPVDAEGEEIADLRARRFLDLPVRQIRTADDLRTKRMAEAIHRYTGAPIDSDDRLNSWDLGNFQGSVVTPALKAQIFRYMTINAQKSVPGGESYTMFLTRLLPYIREAADDEELVCVTHFHCIRAAGAWDAAGRNGLTQDPVTLRRDAYFDRLQVTEVGPDLWLPLVVEDMRVPPKAS